MGREGRDYWEEQLSEYWDSGLTIQEYSELKELPYEILQNIEKNGVEIQQFPVYGMQDWSTLCSSMFGVQTET